MIGHSGMVSSYTVISETGTFILIKDNDEQDYASITNAPDYTVESLVGAYDLTNRRIIYRDSMHRFDELCHKDGRFTGFRPLTISQQEFFAQFLSSDSQRVESSK